MADKTVKLSFDPMSSFDKEMWTHREARILWLLWRPSHLVPLGFEESCWHVGEKIRAANPTTAVQLIRCFPMQSETFSTGDVERFCVMALPYFTGEKSIDWEFVKA